MAADVLVLDVCVCVCAVGGGVDVAVADLLVRVTGKFVGREEGTAIVSATVTLEKRKRWLVTECIVKPAELLNKRKTTRAGQILR